MKSDIYNDPDLIETAKELDEEFPGACYDDSLLEYQLKRELKKKVIKKIVFYGVFYSAFTTGIFFIFRQYDNGILSGILSSMAYGLVYFLIRFVFFKGV